MFGSEYGWGKNEILETVYPEEVPDLTSRIQKRHILQQKIKLAITQNPHVKKPEQLWSILDKMERQTTRDHDYINQEKPDKKGIARLKKKLSNSRRIKVN